MCHGECNWINGTCKEKKPIPVYEGNTSTGGHYSWPTLRVPYVPYWDQGEHGDEAGEVRVGERAAAGGSRRLLHSTPIPATQAKG